MYYIPLAYPKDPFEPARIAGSNRILTNKINGAKGFAARFVRFARFISGLPAGPSLFEKVGGLCRGVNEIYNLMPYRLPSRFAHSPDWIKLAQ